MFSGLIYRLNLNFSANNFFEFLFFYGKRTYYFSHDSSSRSGRVRWVRKCSAGAVTGRLRFERYVFTNHPIISSKNMVEPHNLNNFTIKMATKWPRPVYGAQILVGGGKRGQSIIGRHSSANVRRARTTGKREFCNRGGPGWILQCIVLANLFRDVLPFRSWE